MRRALCLAALLTAGCASQSGPDSAASAVVTPGPIRSAGELTGLYRVAELGNIDMAELDRGISVSIERGRIDVMLSCVNVYWAFRFEGERLVTQAIEDREPCRRAQHREEAAIEDAFTQAERVVRTPANGIRFEGAGSAVTLFSQ